MASETPTKKALPKRGTNASSGGQGVVPVPEPLADMPTPPAPKKTKPEHLFVAWTGVVDTDPVTDASSVTIMDAVVFGRKAECTEFAVDQEPAWKWVQASKGESLKAAILAKVAGR